MKYTRAEALSILQLQEEATESDVRSSYLRLSKKWHPDKHHGAGDEQRLESEEQFKRINNAYQSLTKVASDEEFNFESFAAGFATGSGFGFGFDFDSDDEDDDGISLEELLAFLFAGLGRNGMGGGRSRFYTTRGTARAPPRPTRERKTTPAPSRPKPQPRAPTPPEQKEKENKGEWNPTSDETPEAFIKRIRKEYANWLVELPKPTIRSATPDSLLLCINPNQRAAFLRKKRSTSGGITMDVKFQFHLRIRRANAPLETGWMVIEDIEQGAPSLDVEVKELEANTVYEVQSRTVVKMPRPDFEEDLYSNWSSIAKFRTSPQRKPAHNKTKEQNMRWLEPLSKPVVSQLTTTSCFLRLDGAGKQSRLNVFENKQVPQGYGFEVHITKVDVKNSAATAPQQGGQKCSIDMVMKILKWKDGMVGTLVDGLGPGRKYGIKSRTFIQVAGRGGVAFEYGAWSDVAEVVTPEVVVTFKSETSQDQAPSTPDGIDTSTGAVKPEDSPSTSSSSADASSGKNQKKKNRKK